MANIKVYHNGSWQNSGGGQPFTQSEKDKLSVVNNVVFREDYQSKNITNGSWTNIKDYSCTAGTYLIIVHGDTGGGTTNTYGLRVNCSSPSFERVVRQAGYGGGGAECIITVVADSNFTFYVSAYNYDANVVISVRTRTTVIRLK